MDFGDQPIRSLKQLYKGLSILNLLCQGQILDKCLILLSEHNHFSMPLPDLFNNTDLLFEEGSLGEYVTESFIQSLDIPKRDL